MSYTRKDPSVQILMAGADAVPITQTIELSEAQGTKRAVSPYALLCEVGAALAQPVYAGEITFGDVVSNGTNAQTQAAEEVAMYKKL